MGESIVKIIEKARDLGAEFQIAGDNGVRVRGLSTLPAQMQDLLRKNKTQVLVYLEKESKAPPILWEKGNIPQIRSLLILREVELILAKSQRTENQRNDWYISNQIVDLEIKIQDLKRLLSEAMVKEKKGGNTN